MKEAQLPVAEFNSGHILTQMEAVKSEKVPRTSSCHVEIEEFMLFAEVFADHNSI